MIKLVFRMGLLGTVLCLLTGCRAAEGTASAPPSPSAIVTPSPPPTPTPEPAPAPTPHVLTDRMGEEVPLSRVDFAAYEGFLTPEDWEALAGFFPVLVEGEPFLTQGYPVEKEAVPFQEVLLGEFFNTFFVDDPEVDFEYCPASFALFDCNGDGQQELALWSGACGGWYIVLLREGEDFYGCYMPVRWFGVLQTDGTALGSGGAGNNSLSKLCYEEGLFWQETIAFTDYDPRKGEEVHYYVGGEEIPENKVTLEEFEDWCEKTLPGWAKWYAAIPKAK